MCNHLFSFHFKLLGCCTNHANNILWVGKSLFGVLKCRISSPLIGSFAYLNRLLKCNVVNVHALAEIVAVEGLVTGDSTRWQ